MPRHNDHRIEIPEISSDDGIPSSPSSGDSSNDSRLAALAHKVVPLGGKRHMTIGAALSSAHTLAWATLGSLVGVLAVTAFSKKASSEHLANSVEATMENVANRLTTNTTVGRGELRLMKSAYREEPVQSVEPEKSEGSQENHETATKESETSVEYLQVIAAFAAAGVAGEEIFGPMMKKLKQLVVGKIRGLSQDQLPNSAETWRDVFTESLTNLTSSVLTSVAVAYATDPIIQRTLGKTVPLDAYAAILGVALIAGAKMSPILKLILQSAKDLGIEVGQIVSAVTKYMHTYPARFTPADLKEIGDLSAQIAITIKEDAPRLHPSPASTRSNSPLSPPKRPVVADSRPATAPARSSRQPLVKASSLVTKPKHEDQLPKRPKSA